MSLTCQLKWLKRIVLSEVKTMCKEIKFKNGNSIQTIPSCEETIRSKPKIPIFFARGISKPAACDVVGAVYGKWVIDSDGCNPYCSECKNEPHGRKMSKYCPHCGAEMEGWQQWLNT